MERITGRDNTGVYYRHGRECGVQPYADRPSLECADAIRRLAAYEDTGLTAEQVADLSEKNTPKETVNVAYMTLPARGKCLDFGNCPVCGREAQPYFQHCMYCGQALKWPESPKEE